MKYPVYKPKLDGNEIKYINECLKSTWISSKGKFIEEFENKFADFIGIRYATTTSNGTTALHLALLALGVGTGDEVIVPTLTYIASVNSIAYTGAKPIFVDSDSETWNIDNNKIEQRITSRTKAILVVHLYGYPCNMSEILKVAKTNNLFVIEDCAEAIGSRIGTQHVGTFGDISIFSFFGNKTITTGEGGMVVTNNLQLLEKTYHLKTQGLLQGTEYWHDVIGYNYRMTNICAAIGCAQLERIDKIIEKKRKIARWYQKELKDVDVSFQSEINGYYHSFWMFSILVRNINIRMLLRKKLLEEGIETRPLFYPAHTMPMYKENDGLYPVAENLGRRGINLPSYPDLSNKDVINIASIIKSNL